jgi:integrase
MPDDKHDRALAADLAVAEEFRANDRADATRRAYRGDLHAVQEYLRARGQSPDLPIASRLIGAFVGYQASADPVSGREALAISTIERRLRGISAAHRDLGFEDPCKDPDVRNAMRGARRRLKTRPSARKNALELEHLDHMLAKIPTSTHAGRRDRALLLLGIAGALRRSELVAVDADDIETRGEGILLTIRSSKTDQDGKGYVLPIARGENKRLCAVRALEAWRTAAGIHNGPVFVRVRKGDTVTADRLSDRTVALIVKQRARDAGVAFDVLAGHSLRVGAITQAKRNGYDEGEVAKLSRHKNMDILRAYLRPEDDFEGTAQVLRSDRHES